MATYGTETLKTIDHGEVPETRMSDARSTQDWVRRLSDNDEQRDYKESRVNGLVDGNPPFRYSKLREAGMTNKCNVNWGIGRSYMENGSGAFYDLFSEAPGYVSIETSYGTDEMRLQYSRVMSEEADAMLDRDPVWDYEMQQSQWKMVLHGKGPLMFEDKYSILPRAVWKLFVPEFTPSDTHYWEACALVVNYYPPQLYKFILDEEAASKVGWDVPYTKCVIENAMDLRTQEGIRREWTFVQQELKNNSLAYMWDDSKWIQLAYVFWQEFDQSITQAIVERESSTGTGPRQVSSQSPEPTDIRYLYFNRGRYRTWEECCHPMYFDRGNGGMHHSVTGLGVKMYAAMEHQNRMICNLVDKANSPKTLFKPTTTEATQRFNLAHHGDYGLLPSGYDVVQNPIGGMLQEGLAMNGELTQIMQSTLSQYRQQVPTKQTGNPVTAKQIMLDASQQSSLNKTTYNRYYKQMDALYGEIVRRMFDLNSTDPRAKEIQKRCEKRGVPRQCFGRIERVRALRVIGQGSTFMRKNAVDSLMQLAGSLPEEGRENLIADKIAVEAGQTAVSRYFPKTIQQRMPNDQTAFAMTQVAAMKTGVKPIITSQQNPVTFAGVFLSAAVSAIQSVQQGADINTVVAFLNICGPAIMAHMKRFAQDPLRQSVYKQMEKQMQQLMKMTDQLKAMAQRQAEQQKAQAGRTQQVMSDLQLKNAKTQSDLAIKTAKARQQMQIKDQQHRQGMALADASTASEIHRSNLKAFAETE
jgi:hypothetical protein